MRGILASHVKSPKRIIVVGDIHGCLEGFLRVLRLAGLLDERDRWQFGPGDYLVVCGDMIDEGGSSREVVALIRSMQQEVVDRVIALMGNHELLLLRTLLLGSGSLNWETTRSWAGADQALKAFLDDNAIPSMSTRVIQQSFQHTFVASGSVEYPKDYIAACDKIPKTAAKAAINLLRKAVVEDGTLSWLLKLPVAAKVGEWGFFHGGPPSGFSGSTAELNLKFTDHLSARKWDSPLLDPYVGRESPLATRGWIRDGEEAVDKLLCAYGINHVAFGHSPGAINGIFGRLDQRWGKAFKADTYFSLGVEGYLEIVDGDVWARYTDEGCHVFQKLYPNHSALPQAELLWPI